MFCAANRLTYAGYSTYDGTVLSPFCLGEKTEFEVPVVEYSYLGSCVNRGCNDSTKVHNRLKSSGGTSGARDDE